jgi:hypothetical protein
LNNKKIATITIAIFLTTIMILSIIPLPTATAQTTSQEVEPWPFINAIPNPAQVGTSVLLHVGSLWPIGTVSDGWEGLTVTVTKPDGTTTTIGPIRTDSTGGTGVNFVPDTVGTYTLQTHFPEQKAPVVGGGFFEANAPSNATMLAGDSDILTLIVQEEPILHYPDQPLPTEYWSRPINDQLWSWAPIAGNWLGDQVSMDASPPAQTLYKDYNAFAPETGHVLWAKPITMGGIAGGQVGYQGFDQGDAYEPKWTGAVIIGGKVFYNQFETTGSETGLYRSVVAVDLHTGEELWNKQLLDRDGNNQNLDFGQVVYFPGFNQHGVFDYLWTTSGSTWNAYDSITGRWTYTMEGVPSGTRMYGPNGEIYIYTVNQNAGWMTLWNSSAVVAPNSGAVAQGSFNPQGRVYSAAQTANGFEWNVTIPTGLPGSVDKVREGIILGTDFDKYTRSDDTIAMWALSTEPGREGTLLYNKEWTIPVNPGHYDVQDADTETDMFVVSAAESRTYYGFQLSTGNQVWGPTQPQHYTDKWGLASSNSWDNIAYGKLISGNYGGVVYCRDVHTGETLWTYNITDIYHENLQNNAWRFRPAFFADEKVYLENTEHNPFDPQHRGAPFLCLDMETGERVFEIPFRGSEWSSTPIIGDSIIAMYNEYDQQIYAIGKGPSDITAEVSPQVSVYGNDVLVTGMVTDISPGTSDYRLTARFPNGVPAVSDGNMSEWMTYVYNQFERPSDVTGVEVVVSVVDPNNNLYEVGRTTSDSTGQYSLMFTPEVPGKYTIIATFEGSNSYYGSTTETAFGVSDAQPTPAPQTTTNSAPTDMYMYIIGVGVAMILAIAIATVLILRKHA